MTFTIKTETGSVYVLNRKAMTWERKSQTDESGPLHSRRGKIVVWSRPRVDARLLLEIAPFEKDGPPRFLFTSVVTQVSWRRT